MVAGLKKHQPCRARALCAAPSRWQPSKFAYTVVVRQSAFQGQQRAFTSLMLPGGICNQPLQTAATRARAYYTVCLRRRHGHYSRGPLNGASSAKSVRKAVQKFRTPAKRAAAATVEVAKAPLHAQHNHRDPSFFRRKTLHVNQWETVYAFLHIKCQTFFVLCMTSNIWKVKSNVLYRWN